MSRSITLGRYLPGESLVHRINPRVKVVALVVCLITLFSLQSYRGLLLLLALCLAAFALAGVPARYLIKGLRPILYISLLTLFIFFFFTKGGVVLLWIGPVSIESRGVSEGLFIVGRLIVLVLFSLLVTLTTTPLALTGGLGFFLKPLARIGLPTEEVVMIMTVALRFIPTLLEESGRLMRAQVARGADFSGGSPLRRARNLVPLVVPLFVSAFRRADELALAMEARGYRLGAKRTSMHEDSLFMLDWAVLFLVTCLLVVVFALGL